MLSEFVQTIAKLGVEAQAVSVHTVPGVQHSSWLRKPDGSLERIEHDAPDRKAKLHALADVVAYLTETPIAQAPEVYHSEAGIVAFLDRNAREERMTVDFRPSARSVSLNSLTGSRCFTPKEAVRFLRLELGVSATTLAAFRRIDFTRKSTGINDVQHGRETLGKSVESAVQKADQLPESFVVNAQMFTNPGFDDEVKVSIDVDVNFEDEEVVLTVSPDALQDAMNATQTKIGNVLRAGLGPIGVFRGAP